MSKAFIGILFGIFFMILVTSSIYLLLPKVKKQFI